MSNQMGSGVAYGSKLQPQNAVSQNWQVCHHIVRENVIIESVRLRW